MTTPNMTTNKKEEEEKKKKKRMSVCECWSVFHILIMGLTMVQYGL